jgi:hypothetical protein
MSNYHALARHPFTGKIEMADWLDDSFGHHIYGVRFPGDATIYRHTSDTEVSLHEAGVEIERLRGALQEIEQLSRRKAEGSPNRKTIHQIAFHVITGEKTND